MAAKRTANETLGDLQEENAGADTRAPRITVEGSTRRPVAEAAGAGLRVENSNVPTWVPNMLNAC